MNEASAKSTYNGVETAPYEIIKEWEAEVYSTFGIF